MDRVIIKTEMIPVQKAEEIVLQHVIDFGSEDVPFGQSLGRVLARDLKADRDLPPYDRVTVDGIAINYDAYEKGITSFLIKAVQAAGHTPVAVTAPDECIEIMTGSALPAGTDTIVRYEDISISNKYAFVMGGEINKGQNIHFKGKDKKKGEIVVSAPQLITPAVLAVAASVGAKELTVKALPRTVVISTGDELVDMDRDPGPYQVRKSNTYTISATIKTYKIEADVLHVRDDREIMKRTLENCLKQYDVLLLTGSVSMGKFDYLPEVLKELGATKLFHKVQQRPGKPMWFGTYQTTTTVFAFPGNPVSVFLCLHRYFLPWLEACIGFKKEEQYAILSEDLEFAPLLTYFMQACIKCSKEGKLVATPIKGNGSGDFAHLAEANAFVELPENKTKFYRGEVYKIWPFKNVLK